MAAPNPPAGDTACLGAGGGAGAAAEKKKISYQNITCADRWRCMSNSGEKSLHIRIKHVLNRIHQYATHIIQTKKQLSMMYKP